MMNFHDEHEEASSLLFAVDENEKFFKRKW